MNRKHRTAWGLSMGLAMLVAAPGFVGAADKPAAEGSFTVGSQWWDLSQPEAKYEEYREVPQGTFLRDFSFRQGEKRHLLRLSGANVFKNDQSVAMAYWNGGKVRIDLDYNQIPHNISSITRTPYAEVSPGVLTLPDTLQATNQSNRSFGTTAQKDARYVAAMRDALLNARRIGMGFRTDIARARLRVRPAAGWQYEMKGSRRNRSGTKPYGAPFGFSSAIEIWEPISQSMLDATARLSYQRVKKNNGMSLQFTGGVSAFDNKIDKLVWDNPKRISDSTYASAYSPGDGSVRGQMDLYPDNRSVFGNVALGLTFGTKVALNATGGIAQNTQDDPWLPYTVNTAIAQVDTFPLPGTNTDAKVTITNANLNMAWRVMPDATLNGRYRLYDYKNKTEEHIFDGYVRMDQVWEPFQEISEGVEYKDQTAGVDADWSPNRKISVAGTVEQVMLDRPDREYKKTKEMVLQGTVHLRPATGWHMKGRVRHGNREERSGGEFDSTGYLDGSTLIEQPGMKKYDLAPRVRDRYEASIAYSPSEKWSLSVGGTSLRDDYEGSELGLLKEKERTGTVGVEFQPTDRLQLMGSVGWVKNETSQASRESGATVVLSDTTRWTAELTDETIYWSAGFAWSAPRGKWGLSGIFDINRAPSTYDLANFKKTAVSLPSTEYRRQTATVELRYQLLSSTSLLGEWAWEEYDVKDLSTENVPLIFPLTGSSNAIFLGDSVLDYRAQRVAVLLRRTF